MDLSQKRTTIKDIAIQSGYSKTAVSFAFNEPTRISTKTRDIILATADRLGYIPNPMARNFSLKRHLSIGFLLPQAISGSMQNPYTLQLIQSIGNVCQKYGYTLTLILPVHDSIADTVRNVTVDGLITMGMQVGTDSIKVLRIRKLPFVSIDGSPSEDIPSVNIDDEAAAYQVMHLVLVKGHQRIIMINLHGDEFETSVSKRRSRGYEKALKEFGLSLYDSEGSVTQMVSDCTLEGGKKMGKIISDLQEKPTCIITMSDIVAIGCMLYFNEHAIQVPDAISLVGFDNIIETQLITPALTTVDQSAHQKGSLAAEALFRLIKGETLGSMHREIPYRIVERQSLQEVTRGPFRD